MSASTPPPVTALAATGPPAFASPPAAQPIAVTVQMPPEKHDYLADLTNGGIGLIGALVGAYAAYHFGLKAAREAKDREGKERDAHLTFAVIHKLNKIYGAQKQIRKDTEEAMVRLEIKKADAERQGKYFLNHLSMEVRPLATSPTRVSFSPEEIMAAMRIGGADIQRTMMMIDDRHNTTIDMMDVYRAQKAAFEGSVEAGASFDPVNGEMLFQWDEARYATFRPQLYILDVLVQALLEHSKEDERSTFDAIVLMLKGRAKAGQAKTESQITAPDGRLTKISPTGAEVVEDNAAHKGAQA